ncbi:MAG: fused DSP-PTPase phosphatase/NAD kinase-like protein [Kiritimatiellia bacterium]|jgi:cell wall-associated NlpC family hydrolase
MFLDKIDKFPENRRRISGFVLCSVLLVLAWLNPVNALRYRLLFCAIFVLELALVLWWIWPRRRLRHVAAGFLAVVAGVLLSPSRPTDAARLHDRYVSRLKAYEGVRYLWGGEGRLGIDCSGLPRRALRDALGWQGVATVNGGLLRDALRLWWFDASAKALAEGHRNAVVPLGIHGTIKAMDCDGLLPGDLAITASGVHVLCYLGDGRWIQAEPAIRRVVVLNGRTDENAWFNVPVNVYRWSQIPSRLDGAAARPASWARPIALEGVPNLHQVSANLYRSAQPSALGMKNLKAKGIETIVNLRSFHSDRDEIGGTGLGYEHIYMKAWHPERKEVVRFLQVVTHEKRPPVLVHCQHGADRTGTMCALYRVAVQGWSKEEAIREMTQGGFGFHEVWQNLPGWIEELDVESIKQDAGIETSTEQTPTGDSLDAASGDAD